MGTRRTKIVTLIQVRNAIEKLLLPDQELVIVDSLHDLDDHAVFAALYSSVRTDTVYDLRG